MRLLADHAFAQRLATLVEILEADGDVHADDRRATKTRYIRMVVEAPGYELPRRAVFEYEEWYRRSGRSWVLTDYQYEIRLEPAGTGRKAYHWHDDLHHLHCVEANATTGPHYRGYEIDLLADARPEFLRIHASGKVDCAGLHQWRPTAEELTARIRDRSRVRVKESPAAIIRRHRDAP